jgi:hypothetical protein
MRSACSSFGIMSTDAAPCVRRPGVAREAAPFFMPCVSLHVVDSIVREAVSDRS